MELQLKNIGILKEANVKIDGLTVIAGENDTGKSTVGKALYYMFRTIKNKDAIDNYTLIFKSVPLINTILTLNEKGNLYSLCVKKSNDKKKYSSVSNGKYKYVWEPTGIKICWDGNYNKDISETIFIETPVVWNFIDFFKDVALVESQMNIKLDYPYLMKDLSFKMAIKSSNNNYINIKDELISLMGGEFKKDELGKFYFDKKDIGRVEIVNTATGIKSFGILQMLSQNGWLNSESVLILDEPEVHLHPKWQLEMAKVIIELVKNDVKVLVNSHSPYMIEALKRYSELANIEDKTNFYLAEDGYIKQFNNCNSETLEKIFIKLSEPFDIFEELESQRLGNLING